MNIILPIHPKYSKQIFEGTKLYEYRTVIPKQKINKVYVYETAPTMKIVGEFLVDKILDTDIDHLWQETKQGGCATKEEFYSYFHNKRCCAYKIKDPKLYETPKSLKEFNITNAPQSFVYIKEE